MIERVLVANRGEIARRVFRTCRDLGISTAAVYSDPDADSLHATEADVAVRLPGASPAQTYLRSDLLIAAARAADADAVHPGYGFLSENAEFAAAVTGAGLTWIGPPAAAIAAMGSKVQAKALMAEAGVPLLPNLDPDDVTDADFPVLVKASAGGGGRGMREVRDRSGFAEGLRAAQSEAASAFGDGTVFCEPLLEGARHIEVQILADAHGTVWVLGERECSLQRRHQKVIEETPSPAVNAALRQQLGEAARNAATAIGYVGAGTVEFLLGSDGRFFFLEMNTRLQVEHPVTECVFGLDLVALQLEVAQGARLPAEPPTPVGHAVEARLYAEDPRESWRPRTGTLHHFCIPGVDAEFAVPGAGAGLRVDSTVADGSVVGVHYDPMLAKVIAWAPSRAAALRRLAAALAGAQLHGVGTNRDLLVRLLRSEPVRTGAMDTGLLDRADLSQLGRPLADPATVRLSALAAALAGSAGRTGPHPVVPRGWRNVPSAPQRTLFAAPDGGAEPLEVAYRRTRDGVAAQDFPGLTVGELSATGVQLIQNGLRRYFAVSAVAGRVYVDSSLGSVVLEPVSRFPDPQASVPAGSLLAPMPGTVTRVAARAGATVAAGDLVLVLEAMKMEHPVTAPTDGTVTSLPVQVGMQVDSGAVLAVVEQQEQQEQQDLN